MTTSEIQGITKDLPFFSTVCVYYANCNFMKLFFEILLSIVDESQKNFECTFDLLNFKDIYILALSGD